MYLFKDKETMRIDDSAFELKPQNELQLSYFGFTKKENNWFFSGENNNEILTKIINYFSKEGINLIYDDNIKSFLSKREQVICEYENLKEKADAFKNGNYDSKEFSRFLSFLDKNIARQLKPHQIKAAFHHYTLKNAANFSVPGSGKTSVILSVYEKMRVEKKVNILFVVGPVSSFGPWRDEYYYTLGRRPKYKILSGDSKESRIKSYTNVYNTYDLYLTSYQSIKNDLEYVIHFFNHQKINAFLVVDEAHYIKQVGGIWANSLLTISKYALAKYVLSGTPCPRSYTDLFNLFDFLWSNINPISQTDKHKIDLYEQANKYSEAIDIIKKSIAPLFYRVRKKDLNLSEPKFHIHNIEMNFYEQQVYNAVFERIHKLSFFDKNKNVDTLLKLKRARLIRLRQLTSYVRLLKTAINQDDENLIGKDTLDDVIINYDNLELPKKLEHLKELITKIQLKDRKILIWSNFIDTIKLLEKHLDMPNNHCSVIFGQTPIESEKYDIDQSREKIIKEFLSFDSNNNILIANPAACAESISLHKSCYHAIYYDLSYNCAQYLQSLDRIHRVGGSENKVANYYLLQYINTIDQDIIDNLTSKTKKMYEIIESDSDIYNLNIELGYNDDDDIGAYERLFKK